MEDLNNECKWNRRSRIPGERTYDREGKKECHIWLCGFYRDGSRKR